MKHKEAVIRVIVFVNNLSDQLPVARIDIRRINGLGKGNHSDLQVQIFECWQVLEDGSKIKRNKNAIAVVRHPEGTSGVDDEYARPGLAGHSVDFNSFQIHERAVSLVQCSPFSVHSKS